MSEHGAALQTYNQELVKCLEDLKIQRRDLQEIIKHEESEKDMLQKNLETLREKLSVLNNSLVHHRALRDNFDKTIHETELGFKKIVESSQTLLNIVQHDANKFYNLKSKSNQNEVGY